MSLILNPEDNAIINGDMRISQRGTSFSSVVSGTYTLDRWTYLKGGTNPPVHTITQETDVPSGTNFSNSLKLTVTTPQTTISSDMFKIVTFYSLTKVIKHVRAYGCLWSCNC